MADSKHKKSSKRSPARHSSDSRSPGSQEAVSRSRGRTPRNEGGSDAAEKEEIAKHLVKCDYYFGITPREEIEGFLKNDGDFLVRRTETAKTNLVRITLSLIFDGHYRHLGFKHDADGWSVCFQKYPSIPELIEKSIKGKMFVNNERNYIKTPITRPEFYIFHDNITLGKEMGSGAFGTVNKGTWKRNDDTIEVAIKTLKGNVDRKTKHGFVKEAKLMVMFKNAKNIVTMHGIAIQQEPLMIILELCPGGCLHNKLNANPNIEVSQLVRYAKDAVSGLCYLAVRKVIHRDVAARNCLLGPNDEVKISDFGLSVKGDSLKHIKGTKLPVKWIAPEIFKTGLFTQKSDIWAFGIMLWEIFSHCQTEPFPSLTNKKAKEKVLSGVQPMDPPEITPKDIQEVMKKCWTFDAEKRPDFEEVFKIMCPDEPSQFDDDARTTANIVEKVMPKFVTSVYLPSPGCY
ncbi:unnamed protein product [Bursaphelenchus okinawaensis]|uniref:Tyrosine-protein kinase n=1 Tax=Bursaphelenchus okinawaensis TaxID=465554 RepID=A0A811JUQ0_9BILA|nr:unnamed protein product [Bursaphelenchus okinawaensis]CAG9083971.1 unnamed protein product [Bursaphelenchus okinawaensis]